MARVRGQDAVGGRVQVFWEGERAWFDGVVAAFEPARGYFVQYDDGEEQWEVDAGEDTMRFLAEAGHEQEDEPGEITPTKTSSCLEGEDEEYSDEDLDEENHEEDAGEVPSVVSPSSPASRSDELDDATAKSNCTAAGKREQRPTAAYMRSSASFFRDEETLRELRRDLRREKKSLTNQVHTLTLQVAEKETASAALKRELQQLKTHVTLATVMQHRPMSQSPCGGQGLDARKSARPKTAAQWSECVLDHKLQNQSLTQELLALKTSVQEKQAAVNRKRKQREELRARLARVPRRHLCSLVELQVEIAQLLEEKRALQARSSSPSSDLDTTTPTDPKSVPSSSKSELQAELAGLETTAERYKEQLRQWQLKHDCEQARLAPMEARLTSLQQQLRQYEDSHVLLRSVFLRLKPSTHDERVPLAAALAAFETLAPPNQPPISTDVMANRLLESNLLPTLDSGGQHLGFSQFVDAFTFLFKS